MLLAVDANSLLHRSFHALRPASSGTGEPSWAVRGMLAQIGHAVDRVGAAALVVGFDDPSCSRRADRYAGYKAHRVDKPADLVSQLHLAEELLRDAGIAVVRPPGLEADDVLASAARAARNDGWHTVLVTSDRDAFALVDATTRLLRIINGGVDASPLLTPERLAQVAGVTPARYRDLAALRGDSSDNLPGVRGVGAKTGVALLQAIGCLHDVFADVDARSGRTEAAVGPAIAERLRATETREILRRNLELMAPVETVELGIGLVDPGCSARLPRELDVVRAATSRIGWEPVAFLSAVCGFDAAAAMRGRPRPAYVVPPGATRAIPPPRPADAAQGVLF